MVVNIIYQHFQIRPNVCYENYLAVLTGQSVINYDKQARVSLLCHSADQIKLDLEKLNILPYIDKIDCIRN